MQEGAVEPERQVQEAVGILRGLFQESLLAVYLHGSAVSGGLRPHSDIDLIVVIDRPMTLAQRRSLLSNLLQISGRHPAPAGGPRCIEAIVFQVSDLAGPGVPARAEFIYGEWLRHDYEAGGFPAPLSDPEITLVLAQARHETRALFGPDAIELLPEIPAADVRRAMREALPALLDGLRGDERNVLLTLARMWRTATTGDFITKDDAATWAASRMPNAEAATLMYARGGYLGDLEDDWQNRRVAAEQAASFLRQQVSELL